MMWNCPGPSRVFTIVILRNAYKSTVRRTRTDLPAPWMRGFNFCVFGILVLARPGEFTAVAVALVTFVLWWTLAFTVTTKSV